MKRKINFLRLLLLITFFLKEELIYSQRDRPYHDYEGGGNGFLISVLIIGGAYLLTEIGKNRPNDDSDSTNKQKDDYDHDYNFDDDFIDHDHNYRDIDPTDYY